MTRSPSVTGEAEQKGFVGWVISFSLYTTSRCHRSLPSARRKHRTERFSAIAWPPAEEPPAKFSGTRGGHIVTSSACVTKTRSPQMMGVEFPAEGSFTFQRTFSVSLHLRGRC